MNTSDKELNQLQAELSKLVGTNAAEQIFNDAVKKVKGETEPKVGRKGYNINVLLGGLSSTAGVVLVNRSIPSAVGGVVTTAAASYYFSEENRESSLLKDMMIGAAAGALGSAGVDAVMKLMASGEAEDTVTDLADAELED